MTMASIISVFLIGSLGIALGFFLSWIRSYKSSKLLIQEETENTLLKKEREELLQKIEDREEKLQILREERLREAMLKDVRTKRIGKSNTVSLTNKRED